MAGRFSELVAAIDRGGVRSKAAMKWFTDQIVNIRRGNRPNERPTSRAGQTPAARKPDIVKVVTSINKDSIGSMYTYTYDPKGKTTLPYYDIYPLIFVTDIYKDGFLGINLHYLDPRLRASLMDAIYALRNNDKLNNTTKLVLSYRILKSHSNMRYFKPCVKKYLRNHIASPIAKIPPQEWDMAVMLPLQRFIKSTDQQVWADSRNSVEARPIRTTAPQPPVPPTK